MHTLIVHWLAIRKSIPVSQDSCRKTIVQSPFQSTGWHPPTNSDYIPESHLSQRIPFCFYLLIVQQVVATLLPGNTSEFQVCLSLSQICMCSNNACIFIVCFVTWNLFTHSPGICLRCVLVLQNRSTTCFPLCSCIALHLKRWMRESWKEFLILW